MKLKTKMLKPLPYFELVLLALPRELALGYVIQDGIGLIESAFRSEKDERVILFVYLLGRYRFVEEGSRNLNLQEVGVVRSGEVESTCHFN